MSRDPWEGTGWQPATLNYYLYVASNPTNFIDPTGKILDPSDPTQRGTIIHRMIQAKYVAERPTYPIDVEFMIPASSLNDKVKIRKYCGEWGIVCEWNSDMDPIANAPGRADIVDWLEMGLYEIKPISARDIGSLTAAWHIFNYNEAVGQTTGRLLHPGQSFGPAQIIGTDPVDPNRWIWAKQDGPGVITYWDKIKRQRDLSGVVVYVYEWDPSSEKVRQQPAYAQTAPTFLPAPDLCLEDLNDIPWWAVGVYFLWELKGCVLGPGGCLISAAVPGV